MVRVEVEGLVQTLMLHPTCASVFANISEAGGLVQGSVNKHPELSWQLRASPGSSIMGTTANFVYRIDI